MELCTEKMTIVKGEAVDLPLTVLQSNGKPYDLTGADEVEFCIYDQDGAVLSKKLTDTEITIDEAILGEITVALGVADTELLKVSDNQSFDVKVTKAGKPRIAKFERLLDVESAVCS